MDVAVYHVLHRDEEDLIEMQIGVSHFQSNGESLKLSKSPDLLLR